MRINWPPNSNRLGFNLHTFVFFCTRDNIKKIALGEGSFYSKRNVLIVSPSRFIIEREIIPELGDGRSVALGPIEQLVKTEVRLDQSSMAFIQSRIKQVLKMPYVTSTSDGDFLILEIEPINVQVA